MAAATAGAIASTVMTTEAVPSNVGAWARRTDRGDSTVAMPSKRSVPRSTTPPWASATITVATPSDVTTRTLLTVRGLDAVTLPATDRTRAFLTVSGVAAVADPAKIGAMALMTLSGVVAVAEPTKEGPSAFLTASGMVAVADPATVGTTARRTERTNEMLADPVADTVPRTPPAARSPPSKSSNPFVLPKTYAPVKPDAGADPFDPLMRETPLTKPSNAEPSASIRAKSPLAGAAE